MRARNKMYGIFLRELNPVADDMVLDLGVTPDIDLKESNFFESLYPHKKNLLAVSIEDVSKLQTLYPEIRFQKIAPGKLPFADSQFDILFCSAVIEHVGSRENQAEFLKEIARVSKRFFITTPNRWHPVEFHTLLPFLHWLPQGVHQKLLKMLGYDFLSRTENLNLLDKKALHEIAPINFRVKFIHIKLLGFTSNLIVCGSKLA